ncbi:PREDICTED: PXMP2/4 family protein 4 [Theobroma cacao]|uniref:PXMP2/4 family protein 4 n=1 Tax=Theobroma cacao TaxID=3641 RepID=A0AB32WUL7_THECC|nr:PREDICTED: PXMP2/4 family protein 4 [Theobroma cacao]
MGSSGNTLKRLSKRCLLRLSADCHSLLHGKSFGEATLTSQRWRLCPLSSPCKLAGFKGAPPSRAFSTSSSSSKVGFLRWYLAKLESKPLITKAVTTSIIFAAADFTSQMITSESSGYDSIRTLRMAAYGLLLLGPSQHLWFNLLSKALPRRDMLTTFKKMFLGQAVYGPVSTTVFFSYNAALQGESGEEIVARLKRDLLPTLINGAMFWPLCDFVTYKFVPVHLQPLMNSTCAYIWTIYLTYMASLKKVSID